MGTVIQIEITRCMMLKEKIPGKNSIYYKEFLIKVDWDERVVIFMSHGQVPHVYVFI